MLRKIIAIIPASGIGTRMNISLPKQYLELQGKTILEHSLRPFLTHPDIHKIVVAISQADTFYSNLAILKSDKIQLVYGGETRANSVLNALKILENDAWVLVHDAARPCLKRSDVDKILQIDDPNGAILATPVVDTMKRANAQSQIVKTEDRSTLWRALTPQFFNVGLLKKALVLAFQNNETVTDEASAMELLGYKPQLVEGRSDNLKITHPEDLALAEFYLAQEGINK
ncbi:2-C-methyl-D-erythritol 4-phosphate cytidylyltransferase [Pasteurella atlantica]|uniref:2-C-methyl-D-erythritol 4-phosphate cytidylyltransferase n=1 Tax=Pasteurellaceae TaxID=712 RepID=UPI00276ABC09|nr:2-C-methyl-D-erythritol 4-phosphate cytidylyltransferase [Pasteurella atlantica]MDP8032917.1 2-C-methyl-D-erythritol 4-phosphate cytidylyltransferase [Pasteurella atlantica]MDP8034926.1 2-C-methyl-D-erythritol 4-phosphate cytidylyltransferase [Pasteurella atlantica]MDP8036804.1 2-C-methyl-D-erythritol 4-phosphate cytidylyltransferase [Pasteurella atlantica]MDP8047223.1 2-C-methyl-D-erythritol 4-phosphate cytidylyltransferase [Pasteurella atlantica]MDP8049267.1 2-C-methyl-D-erythritol 4-phos